MSADVLPSPPDENSLWYRLNYTPLWDVLRGRWTASLDFRRAVSAAKLPAALAALIGHVVVKAKVTRNEEVEIARKLAAHFRAGLDAGTSPEDLIASFGDPYIRAKQVKREIKRQRSMVRVDFRQVLSTAKLPTPLHSLVFGVVQKTRLWPSEKAEVARELIAHLQDGLSNGRTSDALLQAFGNPTSAAKLIRRSARRKRSLGYRAFHRTIQATGATIIAAVLLYVGLAVRFYLGTPSVTLNYADELNDGIAAIPEQDRAWPIYRRAYDAITTAPKDFPRVNPPLPPGPRWIEENAVLCRENAEALALFREAAGKPSLGAMFALDAAETDMLKTYYANFSVSTTAPAGQSRLDDVIISRCLIFGAGADLLLIDGYVALDRKDAARLIADLQGLAGMAHHLMQVGGVTAEVSAFHALNRTEDLIGHTLWLSPGLLSRDGWRSVFRGLAAVGGHRPFKIDLRMEGLQFDDRLQRTYTDDGQGDGRMAGTDAQLLCSYAGEWLFMKIDRNSSFAGRLLAPVVAAVMPSRRDAKAKGDELIQKADELQQAPLWLRKGELDVPVLSRVWPSHLGLAESLQVCVSRGPFLCEAATQRRDATVVAIALELYHQEVGGYPTSLQELVPRFLPAVPPDRYDGKPLKYRIDRDRPLLYSIGGDRIDDGGKLPKGTNKRDANWWASEWVAPRDIPEANKCQQRRGDWILWPPVDY